MPKEAEDSIAADNSGLGHKPKANSHIKPEHRLLYLTHSSMSKFLTGPGLKPLAARFSDNLRRRFEDLPIGHDLAEVSSLYSFLQEHVFFASMETMFGPYILSLNPDLCKDFWNFDSGVTHIAKGLPRWMIPGAYRARDRCLASVKKWHRILHANHHQTPLSGKSDSYNPIFGADIVRYRHREMYPGMPFMDANARASEDLGMIWGYYARIL